MPVLWLETIQAISYGAQFWSYKNKVEEFATTKNYYLYGVYNTVQTLQTLKIVAKAIPSRIFTLSIPSLALASISLLSSNLFFASIQYGHIPLFQESWQNSSWTLLRLARKSMILASRFFLHMMLPWQNLLQVALVASSLFFSLSFSLPFVSLLSLSLTEQHNLLPISLSLWIEHFLPFLSLLSTLLDAPLIGKIPLLVFLLVYIEPDWNQKMVHKIDAFWHFFFRGDPTLAELSAPLKITPLASQSYSTILKTLTTSPTITPLSAHWTKEACFLIPPPPPISYSWLKKIFKNTSWENSYALTIKKLQLTPYFMQIQKEKSSPLLLPQDLSSEIEKLSREKNISPSEWILRWLQQRVSLVSALLSGKKRGVGPKIYLREAQNYFQIVLPFLKTLHEKNQTVMLQDIFLKITVEAEGSSYHALRRIGKELAELACIQQGSYQLDFFPLRILQLLGNARESLVQQTAIRVFSKFFIPPSLYNHTFVFDMAAEFVGKGLTPSSSYQNRFFTLLDFFCWKRYYKTHLKIKEIYTASIASYFTENEETHLLLAYLKKKITENESLQEEERQVILSFFPREEEEKPEQEKKIQRLSLLLLQEIGIVAIS